MRFTVRTRVAQPPATVFPVFGDKAFVESLAPGFMGVKVLRIGLALGDEIEIRFTKLGPRGPWVSRIVEETNDATGITFVDRSIQLPWPYATFEHRQPARGRAELHGEAGHHRPGGLPVPALVVLGAGPGLPQAVRQPARLIGAP